MSDDYNEREEAAIAAPYLKEIERLTAELAAANARAYEKTCECEFLRQELAKYVNYWRGGDLQAVTNERDAARTDLAAAREALKPFAAAEIYCGSIETDPDDEIVKWQFAIGDIRRARAALKGGGNE